MQPQNRPTEALQPIGDYPEAPWYLVLGQSWCFYYAIFYDPAGLLGTSIE